MHGDNTRNRILHTLCRFVLSNPLAANFRMFFFVHYNVLMHLLVSSVEVHCFFYVQRNIPLTFEILLSQKL